MAGFNPIQSTVAGGPKKVMPNKPRDVKYVLRRLWTYLFHFKGKLFLALFLSISSTLFALIGPMLSGWAIDAIVGPQEVNFTIVYTAIGWMIGFYVLSATFSYLLSLLMRSLSLHIVEKMRNDVFTHLKDLPVAFYDQHQSGDILSTISYDIDTINTSLSADVIQIANSLINILGSFIVMLFISPLLVLVFVITIPISMLLTKRMSVQSKKLFRRRSYTLGMLNGYIEEHISGHKTIKAYEREDYVLQQFKKQNKESVDAGYEAEYYSSKVGPSVNFINNLSLTCITIFGSLLFMANAMTLGSISSFVLYSRKFSGPINESANILAELQSSLAAAERVFRILDTPAEEKDCENAMEIKNVEGEVAFHHIQFGYDPHRIIIPDLNLVAKKGNLVAIVGPTGAGKTTIINLLMRFYEAQADTITLDHHDIHALTRKSLRKSYAMVLQDTWLFKGTLFENIAYAKQGATMEEVEEAAKAAYIDSFIRSLPQGYQTIMNEDGLSISKGQKQLLTIARAMLMDAHLLILDEATSNVDTRTEVHIQKAMRTLMKNKTCFVIAHRLSTIQNADTILVVQDGNIVEQGQHVYLMEKKGLYYQMYMSQYQ